MDIMIWYGYAHNSKRLEVLLGNSAIYDTTHHILEQAANIYREMRGGILFCRHTVYMMGMHGGTFTIKQQTAIQQLDN